jgi:hypothetical protein
LKNFLKTTDGKGIYNRFRTILTQFDTKQLIDHETAVELIQVMKESEFIEKIDYKLKRSIVIHVNESGQIYITEGSLVAKFLNQAVNEFLQKTEIFDYVKQHEENYSHETILYMKNMVEMITKVGS